MGPFMTDKTTIVTGGAGFVGGHFLKRLREAGDSRLISFDIREPVTPLEGVDYRRTDIRDLTAIELNEPVDRIIHLAAVHTTPGHAPWEYYDANVTGAMQVARFAEKHDVPLINFTSSISVYGPGEDEKRESTAPAPVSDYGRSKRMAELVLEDWQHRSGGRLITCRPAVVFGAGECGNFTRLAKLLKKGLFIYAGRRDTIKSCIYVEDLVSWMLHAETQVVDQILFNGAYSERYTIEDIVGTFKDLAFPTAREITVPAGTLRSAASVLRPLSAAGLGIHPDRIEKLMKSTNVLPVWAEEQGLPTKDRLRQGLERWRDATQGAFV